MGLSGNNPKENLTTLQVLQDIAKGLSVLVSDPKALDQAIKDAYSLSESEKAQAEQARADIEKYRLILSESQKKLIEVQNAELVLEEKRKSLENSIADFDIKKLELSKKESALRKEYDELRKSKKDLTDSMISLDNDKKLLSAKQLELADKEKSFLEYESSLKLKAEKLRTITEGL